MMYCATDVGLSVYSAVDDDTRPQQKRPLAPRPSPLIDGGVTQNFRPKASQRHNVITSKPCRDCDNGMIREPDGCGCVQWTSCYSCGGTGGADDI